MRVSRQNLLPLLRVVFVFCFVRETANYLRVFFVRATAVILLRVVLFVHQVSVPQHVCCSSCSRSFPTFLHHVLPDTGHLFCFCFVLFCFSFVSLLFVMVWLVLLCSRTRYAST